MSLDLIQQQSRQMLSEGSQRGTERAEALWRSYLQTTSTASDRGVALGNLAEVLAMQSRMGEADAAFREALALVNEPVDRATVLIGYAQMVCASRRRSAADQIQHDLETCLSLFPDDCATVSPWVHAYISSLQVLRGDLSGAVASGRLAVDAACRITPHSGLAEAWQALSEAQESAGDIRGALASLEEAIVIMGPSHCLMHARARHGRMCLQLGNVPQAIESFTRAVEFPDLRDQRVMAFVLRAISQLFLADPAQAAALTETLAARLEVRSR